MRVMIDACVLYPTVMREVVLGIAKQGLFEPRWSPRILEEWARATLKLGPEAEVFARGEMSDPDWTMRGLMKKARMPRFGKALS